MAQARRKIVRKQRGASSHGLGMFVAGLVVGAVGASFFMGLRSDDPESIGRGIEHMIAASKERFGTSEATTPKVPRAEKKPSPEFDFYMVLPEIEDIVPDPSAVAEDSDSGAGKNDETSQAVAAASQPLAAAPARQQSPVPAKGARYELQAGAFARLADADRLKARLALAGLESRIQKVTIEGRGEFYRVRLGPYAGGSELESVNRQLGGLGIKALRMKISGG